MKNFAITGVGGYIAPRHLAAIVETGNRVVAAIDPARDLTNAPNTAATVADRFRELSATNPATAFALTLRHADTVHALRANNRQERQKTIVLLMSLSALDKTHERLRLLGVLHRVTKARDNEEAHRIMDQWVKKTGR